MKWTFVYVLLQLAFETTAVGGNVNPGDRDYPALNSNAHTKIVVSGRAPEKWKLHLVAYYYPKEGGILNPSTGGLVCGWAVGPGVSLPYSITYGLTVHRHGDTYTAEMPMDRYEEGHCGWHLSMVGYTIVKRVGDPATGGRIAQDPRDVVSSYPPIDLSNLRTQVDLWCWESPSSKEYWTNGVRLNCEDAGYRPNSPMKFIPAADRGDDRAVYFLPDTKSLTFIFHDLDAEAAQQQGKKK
jgi:hypothetical protein